MYLFFLINLIASPLAGVRDKPQKLRPKIIHPNVKSQCIKETNPCGTEVYNGTLKCCPDLECYEETACINANMSKILKHFNITFGNCYNKTLLRKIMTTNFTKSKFKIIRKKKKLNQRRKRETK